MKWIKLYFFFSLVVTVIVSCKKDEFNAVTDVRPYIPVTVSNAVEYRPGPTISVSRVADNFTIELEIPASSGRTIKEITKVAATTGSSTVLFGSTGLYTSAPVAGNGSNKISFTSSLTEYKSKFGATSVPNNNPPTNAVELTRQFYFLITLDDGQIIIPTQVRVLVTP